MGENFMGKEESPVGKRKDQPRYIYTRVQLADYKGNAARGGGEDFTDG